MTNAPMPCQGSIITYFASESRGPRVFRHAVVTGPPVIDPSTNHLWIPAFRAEGESTLIDVDCIVDSDMRPSSTSGIHGREDPRPRSNHDGDER
jgi:hypothetical protein